MFNSDQLGVGWGGGKHTVDIWEDHSKRAKKRHEPMFRFIKWAYLTIDERYKLKNISRPTVVLL